MREMRELGYLIAYAMGDPKKIDEVFKVKQQQPKAGPMGDFESWDWAG